MRVELEQDNADDSPECRALKTCLLSWSSVAGCGVEEGVEFVDAGSCGGELKWFEMLSVEVWLVLDQPLRVSRALSMRRRHSLAAAGSAGCGP